MLFHNLSEFVLANIISEISKKVNSDFRKASRGVRPGLHFNYE